MEGDVNFLTSDGLCRTFSQLYVTLLPHLVYRIRSRRFDKFITNNLIGTYWNVIEMYCTRKQCLAPFWFNIFQSHTKVCHLKSLHHRKLSGGGGAELRTCTLFLLESVTGVNESVLQYTAGFQLILKKIMISTFQGDVRWLELRYHHGNRWIS